MEKCFERDHMFSWDCYRLNVLFLFIIKAEDRLPLLSQHLCSAGV